MHFHLIWPVLAKTRSVVSNLHAPPASPGNPNLKGEVRRGRENKAQVQHTDKWVRVEFVAKRKWIHWLSITQSIYRLDDFTHSNVKRDIILYTWEIMFLNVIKVLLLLYKKAIKLSYCIPLEEKSSCKYRITLTLKFI